MNKGTILHHTNFTFHDGQDGGNKLLIVLNCPSNGDPYLCCKTTSKEKYNLQNQGCYYRKNIYVMLPQTNAFIKKTWIQFDELYEFQVQDFLQAHFKKTLQILGQLDLTSSQAVINCIKKSEDISDYQLNLLNK